MTNSQSVEQDGIVAGNIFAMLDNTNRGVNRMKFISLATVPYIPYRSKRTWREIVQKDCQARNLNREDAMDHGKWKKLIKIG